MTYYSDESRSNEPTTLPDIEVFYMGNGGCLDEETDTFLGSGWYYWYCLPGCMPDTEPMGPYTTEDEALDASREE